jgi:hypothetical protein
LQLLFKKLPKKLQRAANIVIDKEDDAIEWVGKGSGEKEKKSP